MIKIKEKFKIVTRYRRRTKEEIVGRVMDVDEYLEKYKEFYFPTWTIVKPVDTFSENFLEETLSLIPEKFFLLIRC